MWLFGNLYTINQAQTWQQWQLRHWRCKRITYHHSSTMATTTTTTTMEDEWGLETHMSRAIGAFFFFVYFLYSLLICYFTVTSTTTMMNGHPLKTPTPPAPTAPTATTLTTTPTQDEQQGQREVMMGAGAQDTTVSSPWYIFFLLFYDYTNYHT